MSDVKQQSKKMVLLGGGGHCKSVLDTLERLNIYDEIVITDMDIQVGTEVMKYTVAGTDDCLEELYNKGYRYAFVTVGSIKSTRTRHKLYEKARAIGYEFPNIVDHTSVLSNHAHLGQGIFVGKGAIINADADIGNNAIINTGAIVEHECVVGEYSHISVGVCLCGNVVVGADSFIGAGTVVIQGKRIGKESIVGAGSIVISDINDKTLVKGLIR